MRFWLHMTLFTVPIGLMICLVCVATGWADPVVGAVIAMTGLCAAMCIMLFDFISYEYKRRRYW